MSLMAAVAEQAGNRVFIGTTDAALSSPEWTMHLGNVASSTEVAILDDFSVETIDRLSRELRVDHVVVPDGDAFAFELSRGKSWTTSATVTALVMREKGQPSKVPGVAYAKTLIKGALLQLANLRPRVELRILKSAAWNGFSLMPVSRDPVSLTFDTHRPGSRLLPTGCFWFGVVGSIGQRKNLPLVASSVAALNLPDVGLAVAGCIEDEVLHQAQPYLEQILRNGGRVEILNRLLADSEMDQVITELDCVVLAHSNEGPSGVLGKAVAAGTTVVAAGALTLRSDCRQIGSSAEWVRLSQVELTQAFVRATQKPHPEPEFLASPTDFASELLGVEG
ncbi:hypothetical protein [Pseudarthrobacter raffinosi]|uniref:hypothetical protein n=1 Tax=Pseudarthrobacter raffinosi TaxID=2953651 RepID=UPI00208F2B19|nr:hypothetical protein [Pseudarthrobacter sp. MDT3-9]MCO4253149.1 hypothetical protein [Pseudarthrobacter sp. MDT3-9]